MTSDAPPGASSPGFAAPLRALREVWAEGDGTGPALVRATVVVDSSDPYLAAHFPGFTVFPGVFAVEAVRQAVAAAAGAAGARVPDLSGVRSARFLAPLLAGDTVTVEARVSGAESSDSVAVVATCRRRDGVVAAELELELSR
jgi:3-hydroxyacyl-[acyl-carrier-protein] dehydratase